LLGRGINLGNALEAPREGEWGLTLKEEYFDRIKAAGFRSVRIPIRWSAHAAQQAPYTIDPAFFKRIDWAIDQGLSRGLAVLINVHHYAEMDTDPDGHLPRLTAIWRQVAQRYRSRPEPLMFELLNEPHDKLTDEKWSAMLPGLLAGVRETNPRRAVVIGPGNWNSPEHLPRLRLPDDPLLIVTFHYYRPFEFTHQGASWVQGSDAWLGRTWTGTPEQMAALRNDFEGVSKWAAEQRRPVYLGEFGAYSKADMESRVHWTAAVAREAEQRGFPCAYWEFGSGFGAYDPGTGKWRDGLLRALLPEGR
jgi:endoglucanase